MYQDIIYIAATWYWIEKAQPWIRKFFTGTFFGTKCCLNVLLWIVYDQGIALFGVYPRAGIVLLPLIGVPAAMYGVIVRLKWFL